MKKASLKIFLIFEMANFSCNISFSVARDPWASGGEGGGGEGGLLRISSDGGDRMIFLGLKFAIPGYFWGWKIW